MGSRVALRDVAPAAGHAAAGPVTFLADLGFPCHLDCAPCRRERRPSPRECPVACRSLCRVAAAARSATLRAVFFGGDVFACAEQLEALLMEVQAASRAAGVTFVAAAISDGTAWDAERVGRFFDLGLRAYQVQIDGPPALHDLLRPLRRRTESSFERILASFRQRGPATVIVRVDPAFSEEHQRELLATLDAQGALGGGNPVHVLRASPAAYPHEARELAHALDVLHGWGDPSRVDGAAAAP